MYLITCHQYFSEFIYIHYVCDPLTSFMQQSTVNKQLCLRLVIHRLILMSHLFIKQHRSSVQTHFLPTLASTFFYFAGVRY